MKRFGSWSAIVTGAILLLPALFIVRDALEIGMDPRGMADIDDTVFAVIGAMAAILLLLGGLKARTSNHRLWGVLIICGGVLILVSGLQFSLAMMGPFGEHHFQGILYPFPPTLTLAFMLIAGPITMVGGILAIVGANRGTVSGGLWSSKRGRLTALFGITAFLILGVINIAGEPQSVTTMRKALEEVAAGRGDLEPFVLTYDDFHTEFGGLRLTVHGSGKVEYKLRDNRWREVPIEAGEPHGVSRENLGKLAALLVQHAAWEQRSAPCAFCVGDHLAYLTIAVGDASVMIWEPYIDLEKNRRISEIVDFMKKIAWGQPTTKG